MSTDNNIMKRSLNSNNNEKEPNYMECKRISTTFLDSIFQNMSHLQKNKDPLNTKDYAFSYEEFENNQSGQQLVTTPKDKSKTNKKNYNNSEKKTKKKNPKNLNLVSSTKNINSPSNNSKISKKSNKTLKGTYTCISENYKAKQESEKEKKLYQEKVRLLENRILALKKHENEINRRKHYNEIKQKFLNKKKKEKKDFKQRLLSHDIDQRNALDSKRKEIKERKTQLNKELKESMEKTKISKIRNYRKLIKYKKYGQNVIHEINHNFELHGKNNVNKIKQEREKIKKDEIKKQQKHGKSMDNFYLETCENNKQETDKLKDKIRQLEKLEEEYLKNINETRRGIVRNNSGGIYYFKREMTPIRKLDLNEQMDGKINLQKRYKKNNKSKNTLHRSYDGNIENNKDEQEKDSDDEKLIKVEKKIRISSNS